MKKQLLLLTFTFLLLTPSFAQQYGWVDYRSKIPKFPNDTVYFGETPVVAVFTDVFFVDDNEGWITIHDYSESASDSAVILHTIDGGENWEIQIPPSNCQTIWMLNKNIGYAGSTDGRIYKTTNGGQDWLFHGHTGHLVTDIAFPPEGEIGYAMIDNGDYMYKIKPDTLERIWVNRNFWKSVSCLSEDEVWFVGGCSAIYYNGDSMVFSSPYVGGYHSCILFENAALGWISNDVYAQGYYEPKDSWVALTVLEESSTDMCNIGEDNLWVTGWQGLLINTHNAKDFKRLDDGNAEVNVVWETPTHPLGDAAFISIHASSVNNVFVVGQEKAIMKYTEISGIGEETTALHCNIFPNPAGNEFRVSSLEFRVGAATVELYGLDGRKLLEKTIAKGTETAEIDVTGLQSGVYFCRISTDKYSVTKKLIIQK